MRHACGSQSASVPSGGDSLQISRQVRLTASRSFFWEPDGRIGLQVACAAAIGVMMRVVAVSMPLAVGMVASMTVVMIVLMVMLMVMVVLLQHG